MEGPTGSEFRVLQIHPSLRCNLRCAHCYSASGPEEDGALSPDLLRTALSDARAEGYNVLGVSGGEPLMYPHLVAVLRHASSLGMITTVTTNGLAFTAVAEYAGRSWAGRALGIQNTGQNLLAAATPPALGTLVTGSAYGTAFAAVVAFPLAAALLVPAHLAIGGPAADPAAPAEEETR